MHSSDYRFPFRIELDMVRVFGIQIVPVILSANVQIGFYINFFFFHFFQKVQELHEEEAQWVNYDEDELFVKMQLADGIFEALIRDTIQVLQHIQSRKNDSPTV